MEQKLGLPSSASASSTSTSLSAANGEDGGCPSTQLSTITGDSSVDLPKNTVRAGSVHNENDKQEVLVSAELDSSAVGPEGGNSQKQTPISSPENQPLDHTQNEVAELDLIDELREDDAALLEQQWEPITEADLLLE